MADGKAPGFLRRKQEVVEQPTNLQESTVVREFFMEVARAGDKLTQQDAELAELRQQLAGVKAELNLAQREAAYKHAAQDRALADIKREFADMRIQRDAVVGGFHELRAHIASLQTHCAAVVEAGSVALRAAGDAIHRLGLEAQDRELPPDLMANVEAELIGKKFGANSKNPLQVTE